MNTIEDYIASAIINPDTGIFVIAGGLLGGVFALALIVHSEIKTEMHHRRIDKNTQDAMRQFDLHDK